VGATLAFLALYATVAALRLLGGALTWGSTTAASVFLAAVLAVSSAVDLYSYRLPDLLTVPLAVAGLFVFSWTGAGPLWWSALSVALGFLALAGIGYAYRYVRGRAGLGLGDAKLLGAAGAWLGAGALPNVLLWATCAALVCVLVAARWNGPADEDEPHTVRPIPGLRNLGRVLYGPL
jgi:leader peptidase (prepilin peptidase) / N-methyltransferase